MNFTRLTELKFLIWKYEKDVSRFQLGLSLYLNITSFYVWVYNIIERNAAVRISVFRLFFSKDLQMLSKKHYKIFNCFVTLDLL